MGPHHHALDLQLQVIFPRGLAILSFLPAVAIVPVLHLLPVVEDDAAIFRPEKPEEQKTVVRGPLWVPGCSSGSRGAAWPALRSLPGFQAAGQPLVMSVEGHQVGGDLLQRGRVRAQGSEVTQAWRSTGRKRVTSLVFHLRHSLGRRDRRGRLSSSLLGRKTFLEPLFSNEAEHRRRREEVVGHSHQTPPTTPTATADGAVPQQDTRAEGLTKQPQLTEEK